MLEFVRFRMICSLLIVGLVVTACVSTDPGVTATRSRQIDQPLIPTESTNASDTTVTLPVVDGAIDFGTNKPPQDHDGFLTTAVIDIQKFMAEVYPQLYGSPYPPLKGGIFAAYPTRPADEPIPGCGEGTTTYADVEGNAFYCSFGDFMVYDDLLLKSLVQDLGLSGVGIVLAHEFGHSIQSRADEFDNPTILMEQQADCFAGAWTARVARGESDTLTFGDEDIRAGLIAMIQVRDPVDGGGIADPDAHGTGFDRVGAFQEGFKGGAIACKPFFTDKRPLVNIEFDPTDVNLGNLPYVDEAPDATAGPSDIVTLIPADLDRFWAEQAKLQGKTFTAPTLVRFTNDAPAPCVDVNADQLVDNITYCPSTNQILVSDDLAFRLSEDPLTGDMSVGYLISQAYSESVQVQNGSQLAGEQRVLANDCLTGAWVSDIIPPLPADRVDSPLSLSAGDLDEAIITAIARSDQTTDTNVLGSSFEKVDAFRGGVLNGLGSCS